MGGVSFLYFGLCFFLFFIALKLFFFAWWNPRKIQKHFKKQGIRGPPYRLFVGSFKELAKIYKKAKSEPPVLSPSDSNPRHPILQQVLPHLHLWREEYGRVYLYWFGPSPRLVVTDPELIKQMYNNPRKFVKSIPHPAVYQLVGKGLLVSDGDTWASHRKLLNPFFVTESLKGMAQIAVKSTEEMIEKWRNSMGCSSELEVEVQSHLQKLTQDVMARVAFGDSFSQGQRIVQLQTQQMSLVSKALRTFYIPGSRFLPTPINIKSRRLGKDVEKLFKELIDERELSESKRGKDLLGIMLSSAAQNKDNGGLSHKEIMDECKTLFIAGFETTSLLLTWACLLLGMYSNWQEKAREEIKEVLKGQPPTIDILGRLKILNMVLNETMRIYTIVPFIMKRVEEEMKVGTLTIPAGTNLEVPIISVHHDPLQWGHNVEEFDPSRFADGASKASKHPMAFMPFTLGPRTCIGMNFALIEAKIALAMILQSFTFVVSPTYKHEPVRGVTLNPGHGAHIIFQKI